LLLFTDGAIELVDKQGEELGEAGLIRLLEGFAGDQLDLPRIERSLLEFSNLTRLPADLTLLSVRLCQK
jgi:serine phosphatase RsbU (regulator of sigma subunit)